MPCVRRILPALPAIGGVRVNDHLYEYDAVGQMRLDALEAGEVDAQVSVENLLEEQGRRLREYRFLLNAKRRELVRDRMLSLMGGVDEILNLLLPCLQGAEVN
ncbi:MAG TPA: hypothetical protein VK638_59340 [Edaphobacter sp.]|nr:hypothetical protein [Edaphobacter sp.]